MMAGRTETMQQPAVRVDFDEYAERYEGLLTDQLSFFNKDRGYFSRSKVELLARLLPGAPKSILDFGAGIGLTLPYFAEFFPDADLYATDISEKSLDSVRQRFPTVTALTDSAIDARRFDLIFLSGVVHHIPPAEREGVMQRLASLLNAGGTLCVFEHNPYNPVTRRMVSTCEFDADAVLITSSALQALMVDGTGLSIRAKGYYLFFPEPLKALRPLETYMARLPLGGQHYALASR